MKRVARRLCGISTRPARVVVDNGGSSDLHANLKECQQTKNWKRALQILELQVNGEGFGNSRSAQIAHSMVAQTCEKAGRWQETLNVVNSMEENCLTPGQFEYNAALRAVASSSSSNAKPRVSPEQAMKLMSQLWAKFPEKERNVFSYGMMINGRGKNGQWEMAVDLFEELVALQSRNGPPLDAGGNVIAACERNGQYQEALRLFDQIKTLCKKIRTKRTLIHFPVILPAMRSARRLKQPDTCLSLLQLNLELEPGQRAILTNIAANSLLESDSKNWQQALDLLDQVSEWNNITYNTALKCYSASDSTQSSAKAINLLKQMRRSNDKLTRHTPFADIAVFHSLCGCVDDFDVLKKYAIAARRYARLDEVAFGYCLFMKNNPKHARTAFSDFAERNPNNIPISICRAFANSCKTHQLVANLSYMSNLGANKIDVCNAILAVALSRDRSTRVASEIAIWRDEQNIKLDTRAYNLEMQRVCSIKQGTSAYTRALDLLSTMQANNIEPDVATYTIAISSACTPGGHYREALDLLNQSNAATHINNGHEYLAVYNAAINACASGGAYETALTLLSTITRNQNAEDWARRGLLYRAIGAALSACERAGAWQSALKTLDDAKRFEIADAQCYSAVISSIRRGVNGPWQKSLDLLAEAKSANMADTIVYETVVQALSYGGDYKQAIDIVYEMKANNMTRERSTCNAIVRACIAANTPKTAAKALVDLFPVTSHDEKTHGAITPAYLEHIAVLLDNHEILSGNVVTPAVGQELPPIQNTTIHTNFKHEWRRLCPSDGGSLQDNPEGKAVDELKTLVGKLFNNGMEVQVYGSWAEGVALPNSDVDTSLSYASKDHSTIDPIFLRTLRSELASHPHFTVQEAIFNIRIPVLRLLYNSKVNIDVTQGNSLAVQKSCILNAHIRMSPGCAEAIRMVKMWAKNRGVYGKLNGFPSGFGYAITVLYYVTLRQDRDQVLCPWDIFAGYLHFYSTQFNWQLEAASLRSGGKRANRLPTAYNKLCVEDPVETQIDCASPHMNPETVRRLQHELRRADRLMLMNANLSRVIKPIS